MSDLVIPDPASFGVRVTWATPLGQLMGPLRRANPDAPYAALKLAAEGLRAARPASTVEIDERRLDKPETVATPQTVSESVRRRRTRERRPRTEVEASMVPVVGGSPIPAEPPVEPW